MKQCKAKSKQSGERCKRAVTPNAEVCRMHGGKTPKGIASPHFKNGKRSKFSFMPDRIAEKVAEFINDPEIIQLKENIAITDARLTELYQQFHESEPAFVWRNLHGLYIEWQNLEQQALESKYEPDNDPARKDLEEQAEQMKHNFSKLLTNGAAEQTKSDRIWAEILNVTENRRKLVETETKRLKEAQQFITQEQFMAFCQMILLIIKENVTDRKMLAGVASAFERHNLLIPKGKSH